MQHLGRISSDMVHAELTLKFSLHVLRQAVVLPLHGQDSEVCQVAVADDVPWPWPVLDDVRRISGKDVRPVLALRDQILLELNRVFDMASASAEQMLEDIHSDDLSREIEEIKDLLDSEDEAPVIRLVNTLISQALKDRASDIHIEPFMEQVMVRFRVDGVLHTIVKPPKAVQAAISSRVKVMADLDIAEKRHPQDGRFRVKIAGREVDVRVSILPTSHGERIVMRLLDRSKKLLSLNELGMSSNEALLMSRAAAHPHGIVLVTGPTGSGKSTTLYAALMSVDRKNRNVMTIEDPVEYQIEGVGQMQVQPKIDVTFATGLRSILRQDPDIIMVGEIRDLETAEIAIQASLTGHLVFSTLHTNDALSAIVRLHDMGIEPYLIASSLVMVQAQRLLRNLCPHCKRETELLESDRHLFEGLSADSFAGKLYEPVGCDVCMQTGYAGRTGIFEIVNISDAMREAIHDGQGLPKLRKLAQAEGMVALRQAGLRHVIDGTTSVEELLRVTRQDAIAL